MANCILLLFLSLVLVASATQGSNARIWQPYHLHSVPVQKPVRNLRRLMIGSTKPTCTYNECRGCKHRCIAEQVPVEGNDPINSAYHYRCVCLRNAYRNFDCYEVASC